MAFDKTDFGIAAGGALAFLLGWRRLAGTIWGIGGIYEYSKGHKIAGALSAAGGASFVLFPDWPASLVDSFKGSGSSSKLPPAPAPQLPAPQEIQIPPYQKVSFPSLDRGLDGGWTMLDVRDIRDKTTATRAQNLQVGNIVSLVLQHKTGPFMVFNAKMIGGSRDTMYNGQWMTQPPTGGPQMIDFSAEHVYAVH